MSANPLVIHYKNELGVAPLDEYEKAQCDLWLWLPENASAFPVLLWAHGGGLGGGCAADPVQQEAFRSLLDAGIALAFYGYRLFPRAKHPEYLDDTAAAFAWLHKKIGEHGGDNRRIFLGGHSAGGYLAAQTGVDWQYLAAYGLSGENVAGVIPMAGQTVTHHAIRETRGVVGYRAMIDADAPCWHVRADAPAYLCITADDDMPNRSAENRFFVDLLKTAGHKDAVFHEIPQRDHGTVCWNVREPNDPAQQLMREFIVTRRSRR